jgi:hypothetical protein
MATREQIEANQTNAKKSTGPKVTERTRFNGLTHGLRSEQVVLPGESRDEFEAERQAWFDDWKPMSHTRAVLVERAVVATWKLRRATRAEQARLYETGADAAHEFDLSLKERVEVSAHMLTYEPGTALARLKFEGAGIDRLIALWEGLAAASAVDSGWTSRKDHHDRLLALLGHKAGSEPQDLEIARTSLALLAAHDPAAAASLRACCAERIAELRVERIGFWDPAVLRRRAIDLACASTNKEAQLLHRYEKEHEKSLNAAIRNLLALEKSGADLPDPPEPESEPATSLEAPSQAVEAAPAESGKSVATHNPTNGCGELASVGAAAPRGGRPGRSSGPPGRPGRPIGADPGPKKVPNRS